jgi:sulfonate transport system permease protein
LKQKIVRGIKNILFPFVIPIFILIIWDYVAQKEWFPEAILPLPERVWSTFVDLLKNGIIYDDLLASFKRLIQGYLLAVVFGLLFGILIGLFSSIDKLFSPIFNAIRQIPPLAWIPLVILWFGIGEASKVVIIFKAAFFPVLINTIHGIENTPRGFLEVSRLFGVGPIKTLYKVILPSALPSIFVGLRLGLGVSWMAMLAAELIASNSGIGFRIMEGRELSQPDVVIVGMIVIGLVGIAMDSLLKVAQNRLLVWHAGIKD